MSIEIQADKIEIDVRANQEGRFVRHALILNSETVEELTRLIAESEEDDGEVEIIVLLDFPEAKKLSGHIATAARTEENGKLKEIPAETMADLFPPCALCHESEVIESTSLTADDFVRIQKKYCAVHRACLEKLP